MNMKPYGRRHLKRKSIDYGNEQGKADEITRKSLYGNYYKTTSPISNDIIGIEIIYKQK